MATCLHLALCWATFWASLIPVFCLIQHNSLICCFSQGDVHLRATFGMQFWYILITCPSQFTHWHLIFYYAQAKKENRLDIAVEQSDLCSHGVLLWLGWSLANVTLLQPFSFFLVFAHSAAKLGKDLDKEWITVYCNGCIWIGIYAYHIGFGGADVKTHLLNKGVQPMPLGFSAVRFQIL